MSSEPLPKPTRSVAQALADVDEFGYCMIAEAIDAATVNEVQERIREQAKAERDFGHHRIGQVQDVDGINQWISTLINKGEIFEKLLMNPLIDPVIAHLLGDEFVLSDFSAHVVRPGAKALPLHIDQWWMPTPRLPGDPYARVSNINRDNTVTGQPAVSTLPINPPCVVNAFWSISDFTIENGATRLVPRSHLSGKQPPENTTEETYSIPLVAPAGTCTIWDGRTWHGAGANNSNGERYGVTSYYGGPQFRSLTNFTLSTHADIVDGASPTLKRLLGFKVWNEYGRTGISDEHGYALPAKDQLGPLKSD